MTTNPSEPGAPTPQTAERHAARWWESDDSGLENKSSNELAAIRTGLAVSRTLMAADRTLMAWVRTSLSLNSFGFTIYKLLQAFQQSGVVLPRENSPRNIGLFLTGMGTLAVVVGVVEYWQTLVDMRGLGNFRFFRRTFIVGLIMAALGVFLFFGIITRIF